MDIVSFKSFTWNGNLAGLSLALVAHDSSFSCVWLFCLKKTMLVLWAYRPISTSITLMSLGEMPGMRLACAIVSGSIVSSFCRASVESCFISR